ncbi:MAG: hypothetical protein P8L83_07590 [Flavobacteriaceae bacterium]|nr:hypothetical protein [Flavobacteriaceae bacterium]
MKISLFRLRKNKRYNYTPRYYKGKDSGNIYNFDSKFSKYKEIYNKNDFGSSWNSIREKTRSVSNRSITPTLLIIILFLFFCFLYIIDFDLTIFSRG